MRFNVIMVLMKYLMWKVYYQSEQAVNETVEFSVISKIMTHI